MADQSIRKDFVDGVHEIFTTLFNDGVSDGLDLYLMSDQTQPNVYGEEKYKTYKKPIRLVTQARLKPTQDDEDISVIKDKAEFIVPLKSLQDNNLDVTNDGLDIMRKGVIEFHGVFYTVENIIPKAYIEDVFLMYSFICTEDKYVKSVQVEEEPQTPTEETENTPPNEEVGDRNE